jgi:uncharacterized membrane-anchored protein YjiN (DUF445 family)
MQSAADSVQSDPGLDRLRRMQRLALALLLGAAALFVVARLFESHHPAIGYLRAFGEAALIGGLADWFAVTALFRHPLGLPIPHTAILPRNQARMADALGRFVEQHFLSPEVVAGKLATIDFGSALGAWLAEPARQAPVADALARFLPQVLDAGGAEPGRNLIRRGVTEGLRRVQAADLAADLLEALTARDQHQALLDEVVRQADRFLREAEPELRARVAQKTAWLWKKLGVDAAIADRIIEAAEQALAELNADPEHAWRKRLTGMVREYVVALRTQPEQRARAESLKQALLDHPALGEYVTRLWDDLRASIREDVAATQSRIRSSLQGSLARLGELLLAEPALRASLNQWLREALSDLARSRRIEVAELIAQTVKSWDARTLSDRIERAIGRDLQYIRVNGTLIGGLIGVALHAVSRTLLPL